MKRFITAIGIALLFSPAVLAREQTVLARVTVYWASSDAQQQRASSNGVRLRPGHVAVDPNRIPYGSKVVFADGMECKAVDTGPAVVNRQAARNSGRNAMQRNAIVVDRYFETRQQALAWAASNPHFMTLRVVTPGSDKKPMPERGVMLAQTNTRSTMAPATIAAPSGLLTADATVVALLPLIPLLRAARRRMIRVACGRVTLKARTRIRPFVGAFLRPAADRLRPAYYLRGVWGCL